MYTKDFHGCVIHHIEIKVSNVKSKMMLTEEVLNFS